MKRKNIEIKAKCHDFSHIRGILLQAGADFRGVDEQIDTYFKTDSGVLKLREATLPFERGLIAYKRTEKRNPKVSKITVYMGSDDALLKEVLGTSLKVVAVVKKTRELYTIDNVKFHLDTVAKLGTFVEIEAQDTHGLLDNATLQKQCKYYMKLLAINPQDLVLESYAELISSKA